MTSPKVEDLRDYENYEDMLDVMEVGRTYFIGPGTYEVPEESSLEEMLIVGYRGGITGGRWITR